MESFLDEFLRILAKAQDDFDQANKAEFEANEVAKAQNLAPRVGCEYRIRDESTERHLSPQPHVVSPTAYSMRVQVKVITQSYADALSHAHAVCGLPDTRAHLILWTDASVVGKWGESAGYAVATKRDGKWCTISDGNVNVFQTVDVAELHAIENALQFAVLQVQQESQNERPQAVTVFADSMSALCAINLGCIKTHAWTDLKGSDVLDAVQVYILVLEKAGIKLEFRWVPRGRVQGNIVADRVAMSARMVHEIIESRRETGEPTGLRTRAGRKRPVLNSDEEAKEKRKAKRRLKKEARRRKMRQKTA